MSKLFARVAGFFSSRTLAGIDKAGNRYFSRAEEIDGVMKEKRWVVFKGEEDPTSIPVEWICWLNGQRRRAPTPEEMMELEVRRERVRQNVALLKKEEEERKAQEGSSRKAVGKAGSLDLESFIRQFPIAAEGLKVAKEPDSMDRVRKMQPDEEEVKEAALPESSEPTGSGSTFRPGTWQPPT